MFLDTKTLDMDSDTELKFKPQVEYPQESDRDQRYMAMVTRNSLYRVDGIPPKVPLSHPQIDRLNTPPELWDDGKIWGTP